MEECTVTQEEAKAEMYANEKHCEKCINFCRLCKSAIEDRCKTYRESYKDYLNGLIEGRKENEQLKISNNALTIQYEQDIAELKDQITDIKEDVERESNKQRRLEHDFTVDVLNNLLNKWS